LRLSDKNIHGIRDLYIGVHSSCQCSADPLEYRYILSFSLTSFWDVSRFIGNTYIPSKKHRNSRDNAISDLLKWFKNHQNYPSIIVGDFNMSKQQLMEKISSASQQ